MGSAYTRFLSGNAGGTRLSELWSDGESFSVRRASAAVKYHNPLGDSGAFTSIVEPPACDNEASTMAAQARQIPSMPQIGRPESFYAQLIHDADHQGNTHLHEAAKVGQYVTLALDPSLSWNDKLKYFRHALKRHCNPPPYPDDDIWMFCRELADVVRQHCGQEALRIASIEDDLYAARLGMGQTREKIEDDAEKFFMHLMSGTDQAPEWFKAEDWDQLKLLRDQWI